MALDTVMLLDLIWPWPGQLALGWFGAGFGEREVKVKRAFTIQAAKAFLIGLPLLVKVH